MVAQVLGYEGTLTSSDFVLEIAIGSKSVRETTRSNR